MTRELPILMSGPLVRATIAGRKTETRRPIRPQPPRLTRVPRVWVDGWSVAGHEYRCPYGQPGDLLWVRETWAGVEWWDDSTHYLYRADDPGTDVWRPDEGDRWRPSIHMPRVAARIWLRVTEVRVERVQEITEEGAWAEGVDAAPVCCGDPVLGRHGVDCCGCPAPSYLPAFEAVWDDIYGRRPGLAWADNPWVWVVEYEVVSTDGRPA